MSDLEPSAPDRVQKAKRGGSLYVLAGIDLLILAFLWAPVAMLAPGTSCRPMGAAAGTLILALATLPVLLLLALLRIVSTWPKLSSALFALTAALAPIGFFALLQWLILDVRHIVFEP